MCPLNLMRMLYIFTSHINLVLGASSGQQHEGTRASENATGLKFKIRTLF